MIKKIKQVNYKSFNNYNSSGLEFNRINILYGRNGQGKSSLVNFIKDNIENNNLDIFEISSMVLVYFFMIQIIKIAYFIAMINLRHFI
ncbi:hypothetical protein ACRXHK_001309 [Campylobacter coli]